MQMQARALQLPTLIQTGHTMVLKQSLYMLSRRGTKTRCEWSQFLLLDDPFLMQSRVSLYSRVFIRPSAQAQLSAIAQQFAQQAVGPLLGNSSSSGGNTASITAILETSPQTVLAPIDYTIDNLVPFDAPVFVCFEIFLQQRC
jgi:hypothetical protein